MLFVRKAQNRNRENIARLLRRHGITPTHQRIEIAYVLFKRREHLSADQILKWVNSRYAETSKATVYNTLKLFLEGKLIRELVVDPAKIVYDPAFAAGHGRRRRGHHHPHAPAILVKPGTDHSFRWMESCRIAAKENGGLSPVLPLI